MKHTDRTGTTNFEYLVIVVLFAAAALATAYFLYFRDMADEPDREIVAEIKRDNPTGPVQPVLKQKLTPDDLAHLKRTNTLAEYKSPLDHPEKDWAVYSGTGEDVKPVPAEDDVQVAALDKKPDPAKEPAVDTPEAAAAQTKPAPSGTKKVETTAKPEAPQTVPTPPVDDQPKEKAGESPKNTPDDQTDPEAKADPPDSPAAPPSETIDVQTAKKTEEPPAGDDKETARILKRFAINVLSTQEPEKAQSVLEALKQSPYSVYSYETEVKEQKWLRIRVGFFASKAEAEKIAAQLAEKHKLPKPWVVTPGPQEILKYRNGAGTD